MPKQLDPDSVKTKASTVVKVWDAHTDFKLKEVTLEEFKAKKASLETVLDQLEQKEIDLTPLRNNRDQLALELNSLCVRARSGIKGYFGTNSDEYEQVGGTPDSKRKKPTRIPKATTA